MNHSAKQGHQQIEALDMTRKAVITGLGATSPIGGDVETMWAHALARTSRARPIARASVAKHNLPVALAAQRRNEPCTDCAPVKARRMDPTTQVGLVAAREAWTDAGLSSDNIEPERLAVAFGTGIGGVWTLLDSWDNLRERGPRRVLPMTVPMLMPNGAGAAISMDLSARGGAMTTVSACASG